jgi:tetratricopeptide (TPR) repeat protein
MKTSRDALRRASHAARGLKWPFWAVAVVLLLLTCTIMAGCGGSRELPPNWGTVGVQQDTPENFDLAWRVYEQLLSFNLIPQRDPNENSTGLIQEPVAQEDYKGPQPLQTVPTITLPQARVRVVKCLNNWINSSDVEQYVDSVWQRDALIDKLPAYLQQSPLLALNRLDRLQFQADDFDYLQQCIWMRDVSRWATETNCGPLAANMIDRIEATHESGEAKQLTTALKLFDWAIRNVQLDPLPPQPKDITAGPGGDQIARPAPAMGIAGPGYTSYPWQVMLLGHGDSWERARVFIGLARQAGIDAVMLAAEDTGPARKHQPLFAAARIGERLYLFDTQLGLPIPGPDNQPIATLGDVLDQPELLRQLDVEEGGEKHAYPVGEDDLKSIVALIDAETPALSWRMQLAQQRLSGSRKMILSVSPVAIASRVQKCRGVKVARLWRVPFETQIYRSVLPMLARERPDIANNLIYEQHVFGTVYSPQCMGRYSHLHGRFKKEGDAPPASKWYLDARAPKDVIEQLEIDARVERRADSEQQEAMRKQNAAQMAMRLQVAKWQATIWLGQTQYENGHFTQAENWLEKVDLSEENPWRSTAIYNLARTKEAQGNIDDARRLYLRGTLDESPQNHGNRIRARLLRQLQLSQAE